MPVNFRGSKLDFYRSDIPDDCFSDIIIAQKARIRDERNAFVSVVVVATSRGNLIIFKQRKLWKNCVLPFKDCIEIHLYHSFQPGASKEFLIALSSTNGAIAVDLRTLTIDKIWPEAQQIEVKDEKLLGYPQILIYNSKKDVKNYSVIIHESGWEELSKHEPSPKEEKSALTSVIEALEIQLKNIHGNLVHTKKQISLRQSLCNRSLSALNDAINLRPKIIHAPTYTCKIEEKNPTTLDLTSHTELANLVQTSRVWHFVDYFSDSWVIGATLTNISDKNLSNIQCFFVSNYEDTYYHIAYYQNDGPDSQTSELVTLLQTPFSLNRTLKKDCDLIIVAITTIPKLTSIDAEVKGSIFFTSQLSENDSKRLQLNLGTAHLKFKDACNPSLNFNPSMNDFQSLRRNLLGLVSVLTSEDEQMLTTTVSSASHSLTQAAEKLNMKYLTSAQSYYGFGVYGHVVVLIIKATRHSLLLKIRALSDKKIEWFLVHLKSSLPDDVLLHRKTTTANPEECKVPRSFLNPVINLLSSVEIDDDDEPTVVEEPAALQDMVIEQIRREFTKKQNKILGIDKEPMGNLKIPVAEYRKWQKSWFI